MLQAACLGGIDCTLVEADIEIARAGERPRCDLILTADTLVARGDLAPVFGGAARRLDARGFFLFTLETKPGRSDGFGPKRRYWHAQICVRREAARTGQKVMAVLAGVPRNEAGNPVEDLVVALAAT
jgi:predicted TPR repeat methyltransferase